jgi:hypothetical protein
MHAACDDTNHLGPNVGPNIIGFASYRRGIAWIFFRVAGFCVGLPSRPHFPGSGNVGSRAFPTGSHIFQERGSALEGGGSGAS